MYNIKAIWKEDNGAVLVMVLLVLVATMIIGVSVMRTTTVDTKVAGNERVYHMYFYSAEATAQFGFANMENLRSMATVVGTDVDVTSVLTSTFPAADLTLDPSLDPADVKLRLIYEGVPTAADATSVNYTLRKYNINSVQGRQDLDIGARIITIN